MTPSILYPDSAVRPRGSLEERRFARDLNLDQVLTALVAGREGYDLDEVFYSPAVDPDVVAHRHEVLADLEMPPVLASLSKFALAMRRMRELLASSLSFHYRYQRERVFLDAAVAYCTAVTTLADALAPLSLRSQGLLAVREYLSRYRASERFAALAGGARDILASLASLDYSVQLRGSRVTVSHFSGEPDHAQEVEAVFAKFKEGDAGDFTAKLADYVQMDHVEAQILGLVARLNPGPFGALSDYAQLHQDYLDDGVAAFEREAHFYLAYLDYIRPLREAGLPFCRPRLSMSPGTTSAKDVFDLALAAKLVRAGPRPVCNDFHLEGQERILVLTGPNSGGKTTFARAFGQLHYLASLGLPVPAAEAQVVLPDNVFTSFEQEEQLGSGRSHLEDELVHLHQVIQQASPRSVVVLNESFASTTLRDAERIGRAVLAQLAERGASCACVTFVDELATANAATVSMVALVDPDDLVVRTYKVVRKPPEGRAYAAALAERFGLTHQAMREPAAP